MGQVLLLVLMVLAVSLTAQGQVKLGSTTVVQRAETGRGQNEHDWPERPKLPPYFSTGKARYTRVEAKFAVTNETAKKVQQVTWECTLLHPDTNDQIAKYTIVSRKKIAPYRGVVLKEKVLVPLASFYGPQVVSANEPNPPKPGLPDVVQAVQVNKVVEIKYEDGSVSHP